MSPTKILALFVCCIGTVGAFAETHYWATVGSYKSAESAEQAMRKAQDNLAEQFSVVSAATDKGYFYRVVSGPYLTHTLADDKVRMARGSGYTTAWVWVDGANSTVTTAISNFPDYSSSGSAYDTSSTYDSTISTYDASTYDSSLTDSYSDDLYSSDEFTVEPREIEESEPVPELVDEAPANFNLNKMIRDARISPESTNSNSNLA